MIRLYRPVKIPLTLSRRGVVETKLLCDQYDARPADFDAGRTKFPEAIATVYGSSCVRKQLKEFHNNKCCYSEARFNREAVPVEHFRPKGAVGEVGSKTKQYPGYYWLAYEWTNLFMCKFGINSNKLDFFPLDNEHTRAKNHNADLTLEDPIIINPCTEDPRDHIRFHEEVPIAYRASSRGEYTINLLLRHPELDEDRRTHYQRLLNLKKSLKMLSGSTRREWQELATDIQSQLDAAILPDAEYSSMTIDLLSS